MQRRYFRFGGSPPRPMAVWRGYAHPGTRAATSRALGNGDFYESESGSRGQYPPIRRMSYARQVLSKLHRAGLGDVEPPLRPTGPEPLDEGEIQKWQLEQGVYRADPTVTLTQGLSDDITPTTPPTLKPQGLFGLSRNETRLAAGVLALGVFLYWKKKRK